MMRFLPLPVVLIVLLLSAAVAHARPQQPQLLIYCGTSILRPMQEIALLFEQREKVKVNFVQGGSVDLYKSLAKSRRGDLYLPGEASLRYTNLKGGLLGEYRVVGSNRLAMLVQKGNPKKVQPDPHQLLRKDLDILLSNSESSSCGLVTRRLYTELGIYDRLLKKAIMMLPDSRTIAAAMARGEADAVVTWRSTIHFNDTAKQFELVELPDRWAKPEELLLNLLTFSSHPQLARRFMELAAGPEGQAVFARYGFGK